MCPHQQTRAATNMYQGTNKQKMAISTHSYSPFTRLLSFTDADSCCREGDKDMANPDSKHEAINVTIRAWRSIKRVARRFMTGKKKVVVGVARMVVLACAVKLKRKVRRILNARKSRNVFLNYDVYSYSKNFDDGKWQQEEVEYYRSRSFAYRYGKPSILAYRLNV